MIRLLCRCTLGFWSSQARGSSNNK